MTKKNMRKTFDQNIFNKTYKDSLLVNVSYH